MLHSIASKKKEYQALHLNLDTLHKIFMQLLKENFPQKFYNHILIFLTHIFNLHNSIIYCIYSMNSRACCNYAIF